MTDNESLAATMQALGRAAVAAQRELALADAGCRTKALEAMAAALRAQQARILAANARDMEAAAFIMARS